MSWSLQKKKDNIFLTFILSVTDFFNICVLSQFIVLNVLSEYTYFYISKTLLHKLLLLVFKIVKDLQCIPKCNMLWYFIEQFHNSYFIWLKLLNLVQILYCVCVKRIKLCSCLCSSSCFSASRVPDIGTLS